jgi:Transposase DNA-binding
MRTPREFSRDWAMQQFGDADLGDARRTKRLVHSAACIYEHPVGSLPDKFHDPASLDGYYRLANEPDVTHAQIIHAAAQKTWQRMGEEPGVVLLIEDTTVGDYSGLDIDELGQIGDGNGRGLYLHNILAVTPNRHVLGLAGQLLHKRRKVPKKETKAQCQKAPDRESRLWKNACQQLPAAPAGHQWVDVADRGGDISEFLAYEHRVGRSYLIRSQHNRKVLVEQADGTIQQTKLHDYIRSQTSQASQLRSHEVQSTKKRSARQAELALAWVNLKIVPPRQARGEHDGSPLPVYVIRVWEVNPPKGEKRIEWILLTNVAVTTELEAWERVDWYEVRWMAEEYHKAMKTGVEIEKLQFTTRAALDVTIGLLSVVAVSLLDMRDAARDPQRVLEPATKYVPRLWLVVLSKWRHGKVCEEWTYREFVMALARLGGHQNRKSDHPPGWLVLWRGWSQLQAMLQGAFAVATE